MALLSPVAYHLGLLETDLRKAGERPFPLELADAHVINALRFVKATRPIEALASASREAAHTVGEIAGEGIEGAHLEEAREAALQALDALRDALAGAQPSDYALSRGVGH